MQFLKLIKRNKINFCFINQIVKICANTNPIYLHKTSNYKNQTFKIN